MPGLDWDLNLSPEQQIIGRRLSFSDADSPEPESLRAPRSRQRGPRSSPRNNRAAPKLSVIREGDSEGQDAETPVHPSKCAVSPSVPVASSATLYPSRGKRTLPTCAPVSTSLVLAPSVPLQSRASRQLQRSAVTARTSEYQRQVQAAMQQQAWAAAMQARVPQLRLYTVSGGSAGYDTKWGELHPSSQRLLLYIEEKLGEYKYQSKQLDQCICLYDPSLYKSFELNASEIRQEIGSTFNSMNREKVSIKGLTDVVKEMIWNADIALQSFVNLRPRFVQRDAGGAVGYAKRPEASSVNIELNQRFRKAPTLSCYSGAPRRPSPFIQLTIARFKEQFGECFKWVEELEHLVQMKSDKSFPESLESLTKVMSNMHDYLIHVASKVEDIHQAVEAMKTQYLYNRRCWGDLNDPFVKADTRESAKQEAAVRIVHPTFHLSTPSQPTTHVTASVVASRTAAVPASTGLHGETTKKQKLAVHFILFGYQSGCAMLSNGLPSSAPWLQPRDIISDLDWRDCGWGKAGRCCEASPRQQPLRAAQFLHCFALGLGTRRHCGA